MTYQRPIALSIAGFDPTGGAGILADIKTFEQNKCLGFGVITANTIQTESDFLSANWMDIEQVLASLKPLFQNYVINIVKIGIVQNLETLKEIVLYLTKQNPTIKIVWDTVLASSSGYNLLDGFTQSDLTEILKKCYLITPNFNEVKLLANKQDAQESVDFLKKYCNVYLKGGHNLSEIGVDYLFYNQTKLKIQTQASLLSAKHGSGCVLSSAIVSRLALSEELEKACMEAKIYVEKILASNTQLLGYHVQ
jgi:hydroxymethylpyrimidine/phosphomethylpyrimidine kinase